MLPQDPLIAVVGAGAIGSMLGAHLAAAGHRVLMVDVLRPLLEAIEHDEIEVVGCAEIQARAAGTCDGIPALAAHDPQLVIVCLKAPLLAIAVPQLAAACGPDTVVVSFQNGLDTELALAEGFGRARTLRAVVNFAGGMETYNRTRMTFFHKPNHIGALEPAAEPLSRQVAALLTRAGLDTEHSADVRRYVWEKVILNAALSPLCALTTQLMKQAMTLPETRALVGDILTEGIAVARADGCELPAGFHEFCMNYLENAGMHKPSMLVDVEARRPTEIGYISAKIVDYGERYGIPTPVNTTITRLVLGVDSVRDRTRWQP